MAASLMPAKGGVRLLSMYLPALQGIQALSETLALVPIVIYLPREQSVQSEPEKEYLPAVHVMLQEP